MPKRNITHRSGKQLYLNKMFLKGMLYTSSEMQEGYAKVIDNYDIAPTGDAASPRQPFTIPYNVKNIDFKYTKPVKFKQLKNAQAYVRFKRTVSEKDFIDDTLEIPTDNPGKTIDILYRNDNAFNEGSLSFEQLDYNIIEDEDNEEDVEDTTISSDTNVVNVSIDSNYKMTVSENTTLSGRDDTSKNTTIEVSLSEKEYTPVATSTPLSEYSISARSDFIRNANIPCKLEITLKLKKLSQYSELFELWEPLVSIVDDMHEYAYTNIVTRDFLAPVGNVELFLVTDSEHINLDKFKITYKGKYSAELPPFAGENDDSEEKTFNIYQIAKSIGVCTSENKYKFIDEVCRFEFTNHIPNPCGLVSNKPFAQKASFFGYQATTDSGDVYEFPFIKDNDFGDVGLDTSLKISIVGDSFDNLSELLSEYLKRQNTAFRIITKYFIESTSEELFIYDQESASYIPHTSLYSTDKFKELENKRFDTTLDYVAISDTTLQEKLVEHDNELNTLSEDYYTYITIENLEVIDGDTFKYNDKKYRLWAADSVEENYKWYHYSKWFLQSFLESVSTNNFKINFEYKANSYDREVTDISIFTSSTGGLSCEKTSIKDLDNSNLVNRDLLKEYITYPVYLDTFNPNYSEENATAIYQNIENRTPCHLYDYIKVFHNVYKTLFIKKYPIAEFLLKTGIYTLRYGIQNYATPEEIELLSQYQKHAIDNGYYRWWDEENFSETRFTDPYYTIQDIFTTIEDGDSSLKITDDMYIEALCITDEYNISAITKTKIDIVQSEYIDYMDAVGFLGRVIDYKTESIVYKGLILLKAELTDNNTLYFRTLLPNKKGEGYEPSILEAVENGYNLYNSELLHITDTEDASSALSINGLAILKTEYNSTDNSFTVNKNNPVLITKASLGQTVSLEAILNQGYYVNNELYNTDKWGYNIYIEIPDITFKDSDETTVATKKLIATITKDPSNISNNYYYTKNFNELLTDSVGYDSISFSNVNITKVELITPDYKLVEITSQSFSISLEENLYKVESILGEDSLNSLFELKLKVQTNELKENISIEIYDNFSAINKTIATTDSSLALVDRTIELNIVKELYTQWSVASFGSNDFVPLQDEVHLYNCVGNTLTRQEDVSEDLLYTINRAGPLTFKFNIRPKVRITTNEEHPLYNYYITNTYEELYQVYPRLDVSNEIEYVSTKSLVKNINIKNATRLGLFNRQLILYGDNIGSNILQFSKFEYYDYYPFPLNTIELPEPIVYVVNYKDALIIFGKTSIYMLSGGVSVQECTLNKIYENLSCKLPDIRLIKPIGNNLMFFNNGTGYIIIPNMYVDSSSNIKVYKLTEHINNFFYNPEEYIRTRLEEKNIPIASTPTYTINFDSYIENNTINIIANIEVLVNQTTYYLTTIFIYHQDYRYWRMYSVDIFDSISENYICEPNLNTQFIIKKQDKYYLSYMANGTSDFRDSITTNEGTSYYPIATTIMSGYLSVDTMNDKRFKDIIIEFDKINSEDILNINFEFFVDSSPIVLSSENVLVIDKLSNSLNNTSTDKLLTGFSTYSAYHISQTETPATKFKQPFGVVFDINNQKYSITGRTHIRIPVFGKGRLPSFILKIKANKFYEFINYALIYKEKNINRRS